MELGLRFSHRFRGANNLNADAHHDDRKRFVVHADKKLTAFLELKRAICVHLLSEA